MTSFIYDTDFPWSFFPENIVFHCSQGGAIRHTGISVRQFFCMNLLAPHPMFTASFRKKGQIPDLKVILHHILLPRRGILCLTTNI